MNSINETTPKKKRKRKTKEQKIASDINKLYINACPDAVRLLIQIMNDETAKIDLRLACAEKIIERAYGKKTSPALSDKKEAADTAISILLASELEEYAK